MAAILTSLRNTVITGFILTVLMLILVGAFVSAPGFDQAWWAFFVRWLHVLSNAAAAEALTSILISINRHHQIDGAGIKITGAPKSDQ